LSIRKTLKDSGSGRIAPSRGFLIAERGGWHAARRKDRLHEKASNFRKLSRGKLGYSLTKGRMTIYIKKPFIESKGGYLSEGERNWERGRGGWRKKTHSIMASLKSGNAPRLNGRFKAFWSPPQKANAWRRGGGIIKHGPRRVLFARGVSRVPLKDW